MAEAEQGTIVSTDVICKLLIMSRQRIDALVSEGVLFRHSPGRFKLVETIQGYIRWMRDENRRQNRSAADGRVRDARAREIEVKTLQRLSRLVPLEAYEEMIDGFAGVVRSEFAGLAAASSRDLKQRAIIEREVNARLHRIAEYAMAQAVRLEAVRGADPSVSGDGAGRVGGGEQDIPANGGGAGTA